MLIKCISGHDRTLQNKVQFNFLVVLFIKKLNLDLKLVRNMKIVLKYSN